MGRYAVCLLAAMGIVGCGDTRAGVELVVTLPASVEAAPPGTLHLFVGRRSERTREETPHTAAEYVRDFADSGDELATSPTLAQLRGGFHVFVPTLSGFDEPGSHWAIAVASVSDERVELFAAVERGAFPSAEVHRHTVDFTPPGSDSSRYEKAEVRFMSDQRSCLWWKEDGASHWTGTVVAERDWDCDETVPEGRSCDRNQSYPDVLDNQPPVEEDEDRDGFYSSNACPSCNANNTCDCDENSAAVHPGAYEACAADGGRAIDHDCNTTTASNQLAPCTENDGAGTCFIGVRTCAEGTFPQGPGTCSNLGPCGGWQVGGGCTTPTTCVVVPQVPDLPPPAHECATASTNLEAAAICDMWMELPWKAGLSQQQVTEAGQCDVTVWGQVPRELKLTVLSQRGGGREDQRAVRAKCSEIVAKISGAWPAGQAGPLPAINLMITTTVFDKQAPPQVITRSVVPVRLRPSETSIPVCPALTDQAALVCPYGT